MSPLAILGFLTVIIMLVLIMTKKASPLVALIVVPVVTGMITEMASTLVSIIPHTMGKFFPLIIGIIGMPASLLFDPDSFYYGVLPVLAQTAEGFGVAGVDVGRAAILGQMTIGFPVSPLTASTFLLVGLSGVDFGEHQKKTIPLAWLVSLVMVVVAILTRGIAI